MPRSLMYHFECMLFLRTRRMKSNLEVWFCEELIMEPIFLSTKVLRIRLSPAQNLKTQKRKVLSSNHYHRWSQTWLKIEMTLNKCMLRLSMLSVSRYLRNTCSTQLVSMFVIMCFFSCRFVFLSLIFCISPNQTIGFGDALLKSHRCFSKANLKLPWTNWF